MSNAINWFEIPTADYDRAIKFYSKILGQPVNMMDFQGQKLGFFPMEGREGVGGNLVPPGQDGNMPSGQGTRVFLNCEGQLDEVIGRVEAAGGKIVKPKHNIGEPGWIAYIEDSEGNVVGLHSMK